MQPIVLFSMDESRPPCAIPCSTDYIRNRIKRDSTELNLLVFYRIDNTLNDLPEAIQLCNLYERANTKEQPLNKNGSTFATLNAFNSTALNDIYDIVSHKIHPVLCNHEADYDEGFVRMMDSIKPIVYYDDNQRIIKKTQDSDNPFTIRSTEWIINEYCPELIDEYDKRYTHEYIWNKYGKIAIKYTIKLGDYSRYLNDNKEYAYKYCVQNKNTHPDIFKTWLVSRFAEYPCLRLNTLFSYNDRINYMIKLNDTSVNINAGLFDDIPGTVL